jgi:hypothetical protein
MATNPYFNQKSPVEQQLIEDMTVELIRMFGQDMMYIPRDMIKEDKIFGEAEWYKFVDAFPLEMYIETINGFEGSGDVMVRFGMQVKDRATLVVARKRFNKEVNSYRQDIIRPREGDLIYFPLSKGIFEINFVEHENPFYVLGRNYSYKLTCELFNYDHSSMDTGIQEIDNIETENNTIPIIVNVTKIPGITLFGFYEGETVGQYLEGGSTGQLSGSVLSSGIAISYTTESSQVIITGADDMGIVPGTNNILYGVVSGAKQYISGISGINMIIPKNPISDENFGDNDIISLKSRSDRIINYCETDPFSEGSV